MQRKLQPLTDQTFDLLVIGGGIFGACAANDAAQRGLSVALIDRGDFCSATSANSYKLLHGGLRYLQHADLIRLRESARARRAFIRVAPHLAHPLPIVVPTYGFGMKGKPALCSAMAIYDALTFDRNQGVADSSRRVPLGRTLSRQQVLSRYPGLDSDGLTGAGVFCDGQMYNPPRLVLAYIKTAVRHGALAANYVEATSLIREGDRVTGVEARDVLGGQVLVIRARVVLNAAGPYAEGLLYKALGRALQPPVYWSRDAFVVVDRLLVEPPHALALQARSHDPEAVLSRGARHLFLVPWQDQATLVGVWHKVYRGHPDEYTVTDQEIKSFVDEINAAYTSIRLTPEDVSLWNAGLIPFGENANDGSFDLKFAHRSRLVDHTRERQLEGLITLVGVRYTTGPLEAVKAVDLAFRKLGRVATRSVSHRTPLVGGDFSDFQAVVRRMETFDPRVAKAIAHNYGTECAELLKLIEQRKELARTIGENATIAAEVVHAVRHEMVQTLQDVVLRRTDLGTAGYPGRSAIEDCARLMGNELGWDPSRAQRETEACITRFGDNIRRCR